MRVYGKERAGLTLHRWAKSQIICLTPFREHASQLSDRGEWTAAHGCTCPVDNSGGGTIPLHGRRPLISQSQPNERHRDRNSQQVLSSRKAQHRPLPREAPRGTGQGVRGRRAVEEAPHEILVDLNNPKRAASSSPSSRVVMRTPISTVFALIIIAL
jgi:hypothetical protein